ncbi:MAG: hypothetical protein WCQ55_07880 [Paludibacteraceae bacterium]
MEQYLQVFFVVVICALAIVWGVRRIVLTFRGKNKCDTCSSREGCKLVDVLDKRKKCTLGSRKK